MGKPSDHEFFLPERRPRPRDPVPARPTGALTSVASLPAKEYASAILEIAATVGLSPLLVAENDRLGHRVLVRDEAHRFWCIWAETGDISLVDLIGTANCRDHRLSSDDKRPT